MTGDSMVTALSSQGDIVDSDGNTVSIAGRDGTVYVKGTGLYTVTVSAFLNTCDLSGAGTASNWSDHAMNF